VKRQRKATRTLAGALLLSFLCGCAPYAELRKAARAGDIKRLSVLVREKLADDRLNSQGLRRTAFALLEGEIERAEGETGAARISSLAGCVDALKKPLSRRSEEPDLSGGVAALLLVESERGRRGVDESWITADEPHFRAAFVRTLIRPEDDRRPYFREPDTEVRRAALDAALDALASNKKSSSASDKPGSSNSESLSDEFKEIQAISGSDPDTLCRSKALSWLGRSNSKHALQIIVDRFQMGDEKARILTLGALYQKAQHDPEAQGLLYELGVSASGRVGLEAAFFMLSLPELDSAKDAQPSSLPAQKARAEAKLLEAARHGALDERASILGRHAIDSREWFDALQAATDPAGGSLAIAALGRLTTFSETRASATRELLGYAQGTGEMATLSSRTLAEHGEARIVPLLQGWLQSGNDELRHEAALNLLQLGREHDVAPLLADDNTDIRLDVACVLLADR